MSNQGPRGKTGRMGLDGPTGPAGPSGGSISNGNTLVIPNSNTAPLSPVTGMMYCNTKEIPASLQFYDGQKWVIISSISNSIILPKAPVIPKIL